MDEIFKKLPDVGDKHVFEDDELHKLVFEDEELSRDTFYVLRGTTAGFFIYESRLQGNDDDAVFRLSFKLPVMKYSKKQKLVNCRGDKCRYDNCVACYGDRNHEKDYRAEFPLYRRVQLCTIFDDIYSAKIERMSSDWDVVDSGPCNDCQASLETIAACKETMKVCNCR